MAAALGSSTTFEICFVFAFVFVCLSCILEDIKQRGMNGEKRKKKGRPDLGRYYVKLVYMRCTHTHRKKEVSSSISCLSSAVSTLEFFSLPLYIQTCISYEWLSLSLSSFCRWIDASNTHLRILLLLLPPLFVLLSGVYLPRFSPHQHGLNLLTGSVSLSLLSSLCALFRPSTPKKLGPTSTSSARSLPYQGHRQQE